MLRFRRLTAGMGCGGLLLAGLWPAAHAHDTISFDPNAPSQFSLKGAWGVSTPTVLHGVAEAVLRPEGMEIDLTMADGAAYKLLDPNQATAGAANTTTDINGAQFAKDEPLLIARARTFFNVTNNGAALAPGSVSVELTAARDLIFHLIYPPPAPGPLKVEMTYLGQIPAGQKDLLTVLDRSGATLGSATLGAGNPALEVTVAAPGAIAASQAANNHWLIVIAGVLTMAAVLALLNKLRKGGTGG